MPVDPLLQGLVAGFLDEARDLAEQVTASLRALERAPAGGAALSEHYNRAARGLHTLKGSAATLGLDDVATLAHQMEDQLAPFRKSLQPLPAPAADALLESLDGAMARVRAHAQGQGEGSLPDAPPTKEEPRVEVQAPEKDEATEQDALATWRVSADEVVSLMREAERLREVRLRLDLRRRELDRAAGQLARLGILAQTAEPRMRVLGVERGLRSDSEEVADIVAAVEERVRAISTLPVRSLAEPLHRAVREVCRGTGKQARLSLVGSELSLDRRVLDALKPALTHLVRNAVDHGIETPAERTRCGKHLEGALVIRFEQHGSIVSVEVSDDGAGIDPARVREVARRRGVAGGELEDLDDAQVRQLVFRSGFSTAREVTATSGRGVGLDVVRAQVQGLKGSVVVQSTTGQGTRFLLTLPTELGGSPVLVVRCGEQEVGLPLLCVESIVPSKPERIHAAATGQWLEHQGKCVPLEDLGERLRLRLRPAEAPGDHPLVVLQFQGDWAAFGVDEVLGEQDLVLRSLPAEVRGLDAYQGAAVLAHGELLPVLRADWLVKQKMPVGAVAVRRVLVVDDSLTARAIHRSILEAGGFTVHAVGSARRALEQLRNAAYSAVVADVTMADMDGLELVRATRALAGAARVPFVLVSANAQLRASALEAGADGFLSKAECASGRLLAELEAVMQRAGARGTPE